MKRLIVLCILAVSGVAITATPCWACSCVEQTKEEQADNADAVWYGKVREISGGDTDDGTFGDDNLRVRFRVRTVYKGKNIKRSTIVRTNESGAACGYETFEEGKRYTVFADRSNGKLYTSLCSGTKRGNIDPDNYGLPEGHPPED
ncbi:MAG: hypothetical protein ACRDLB_08610 [Actinomycetota bacterium]